MLLEEYEKRHCVHFLEKNNLLTMLQETKQHLFSTFTSRTNLETRGMNSHFSGPFLRIITCYCFIIVGTFTKWVEVIETKTTPLE